MLNLTLANKPLFTLCILQKLCLFLFFIWSNNWPGCSNELLGVVRLNWSVIGRPHSPCAHRCYWVFLLYGSVGIMDRKALQSKQWTELRPTVDFCSIILKLLSTLNNLFLLTFNRGFMVSGDVHDGQCMLMKGRETDPADHSVTGHRNWSYQQISIHLGFGSA